MEKGKRKTREEGLVRGGDEKSWGEDCLWGEEREVRGIRGRGMRGLG